MGCAAGDLLWAARVAGLRARKAGKEAVQEYWSSSGEEMTDEKRESLLPDLVTLKLTVNNNKIQATCSQAYLRIQVLPGVAMTKPMRGGLFS